MTGVVERVDGDQHLFNSLPELDTDLVDSDLYDKLHGGWIGRCVGHVVASGLKGEQGSDRELDLAGLVSIPQTVEHPELDRSIDWLGALEASGLSGDGKVDLDSVDLPETVPPPSDICGYLFPGRPGCACDFVSQHSPGVESLLFVVAAISASFVLNDVGEITDLASRAVPTTSPAFEFIQMAFSLRSNHSDWREAADKLCVVSAGTEPDVIAVALGMLYGEGDFHLSMEVALRCPGDATVACATVGSILGVIHESSEIPPQLKDPLQDRVMSDQLAGGSGRISELARRTLDVIRTAGTNA